ncbi:MAG: DUF1573 domain-containing protein [Parcubacteria group bacterium]|nr:DUF1573 domain-containing protein [Parcubacteria group bacterium]MBI4217420.1 DUF1573 domain-containing protein [Parcubacteria group bacterium]
MNKAIIGIVITVLVLGGLVWIARPNSQSATATLSTSNNGTLAVEETNNYDFGTISMAAGKVNHAFKIRNTGTEPVVIGKMYTSCMCTTASLLIDGKQFGPYGMLGHGFVPKIGQTINPGEEATVEAVFDPAAHGPAGVGRIQRAITIEHNAGQPVELLFDAIVTP